MFFDVKLRRGHMVVENAAHKVFAVDNKAATGGIFGQMVGTRTLRSGSN